MAELWSGPGGLISEEDWINAIRAMRSEVAERDFSEEQAAGAVAKQVTAAVMQRIPQAPFGVLFSGGLDSTTIAFLCKKANAEFTCYAVGMDNSKDMVHAAQAAQMLGLDLKKVEVTESNLRDAAANTVALLHSANYVNVSVGIVEYLALQSAAKDGVRIVFSGLGAEELFAGYQRHALAADINAECWAGLAQMHQRDLLRERGLSSHFGMDVRTPFLDEQLIRLALSIPGRLKIKGNIKKYVLHKAGLLVGLGDLAGRPKLAAQYGSGIDRGLQKLARSSGFKHKSGYLQSLLH